MPGRYPVYTSPSMVVEFEMDRAGIREVAMGRELRKGVDEIVAKALPYAVNVSPERTGAYKAAWKLDTGGSSIVAGMRRVAARLVNTDAAAAAIEWGNKQGDPAHHTLREVLEHIADGHISDVACSPGGCCGHGAARSGPRSAVPRRAGGAGR